MIKLLKVLKWDRKQFPQRKENFLITERVPCCKICQNKEALILKQGDIV